MRGAGPALLTLAAAIAASCVACGVPSTSSSGRPLVFAAASLRDVLADVGAAWAEHGGTPPTLNLAGSNVLAQQLLASPAGDVFISADELWIDELDAAGRVRPGSRRTLVSNRLAIVAREDAGYRLSAPAELVALDFDHLALADPRGVPAGRYAAAFLAAVETPTGDLATVLADRLAPTVDVRAALALVEASPRTVGVVYTTDARTSKQVRVLYEVPPELTPPIRYGTALLSGASAEAAELFAFLGSDEAAEIFRRHGFAAAAPGGGR